MNQSNTQAIILATQHWLDQFIIEFQICPFAKKVRDNDQIDFVVDESETPEQLLENLSLQWRRLDNHSDVETSLFIIHNLAGDFDEFLNILDMANHLLELEGYEGIYQLASFHPEYQFEGSNTSDPENYTNRSPYPMLHIIREQSLEKILANYPNPEKIPERNIELCRQLGLEHLKQLLSSTFINKADDKS